MALMQEGDESRGPSPELSGAPSPELPQALSSELTESVTCPLCREDMKLGMRRIPLATQFRVAKMIANNGGCFGGIDPRKLQPTSAEESWEAASHPDSPEAKGRYPLPTRVRVAHMIADNGGSMNGIDPRYFHATAEEQCPGYTAAMLQEYVANLVKWGVPVPPQVMSFLTSGGYKTILTPSSSEDSGSSSPDGVRDSN